MLWLVIVTWLLLQIVIAILSTRLFGMKYPKPSGVTHGI
jgi:hypothetical protein